ncbi:MAG: hypothetical protein KC503_10080 [Myxococcales bacterium]|nr:hypothetical protein [Myxococcales bacterium]
MKLSRWVLLAALAGAGMAGCAGARTVESDGTAPQFDGSPKAPDLGQREQGFGFPDVSVDGLVTQDGPTPDLPPAPDGPRGDQTVDSKPGVVDEDNDGHCAPGQQDPNGICKSFNDCDDRDNTRHPDAIETCANRGVDNDCDGDNTEVDENNDGVDDIGEVCTSGSPGICSPGKKACTNGGTTLTCVPDVAVGSQTETCNGKDDNCDGTVDNGNLCGSGETCTNGACRCGTGAACSSSTTCCSGGCRNLASNTSHCGACGVSCGAGETCSSQRCRCGSTSGGIGAGPACSGGQTCNGTSCVTPCNSSVNIAPSATPTSSGGGVTTYGPQKMNDRTKQATCDTDKFHWISAPNGSGTSAHWIRYTWPSAVRVGRVVFDTVVASTGGCGATPGRSLAGGTLQYLSGSTWVNLVTVSGQANDWSRSFTPVMTTSIRLINAHAHSSGNPNPVIIEWEVFCQ